MTNSFININGKVFDASTVTLPSDRRFRNAWVLNGKVVEIDRDLALSQARDKAEMDRLTFAVRAAQNEYLSFEDAAAWAAGNSVPAAVQAVLDTLPEEQRGPALVDVLSRQVIKRTGNLMPAIAAAFQTDDAGLDALFGIDVP
jgi:hypothetical protein